MKHHQMQTTFDKFRSCNSVPKGPAERMLIKPRGEWQWDDVTWDGVGRHSKVNLMLGALCRHYYPGMVEVDGEWQEAEQSFHWRLKEYLRYHLENEDDMEVLRSVIRHFCRAAEKVIDDAFYNARILVVCQYYKRIKGENMSKEKGLDVEAWRWLAKKWSTPEWIASSKLHRENRGKEGPGHQFGTDGHYSLVRRMEHESGVPSSFMDVFVRGHRGLDPTNPEMLCTEAAREKMMAYGEEITQRHGPDFDWRQAQEFSLLKDSSRYPGTVGGSCSTRGGSSGNTNGQAADKHDSLHGFLPSGYHSSIGTRRELATLLPSSNVSAARVDRVGTTTPRLATTSGVDDGTTGLPATSRVDGGTPGLPDTSGVDGSGVDGTAGLSATSQLDGTTGLPDTSGMDDTLWLLATFGVDASCCTTLQPVDAISSSATWITGFGLTPSWPNSRCGRER
ncbi:hypothetical protein U9M48_024962 [Paspalum notatum var. saurae]|uniref:Uncharacterized protein n=1 Tax=Paspalum notatum var. saurae TaxID=547442 RepID=A0AAQ3TSK5_PASNO